MDNIFLTLRENEKKQKGKRIGFSAEELSKDFKKLGFTIDARNIRRLERDEISPSVTYLKAYSKRFNVTTDYLLGLPQKTINDEDDFILTISEYTGLSVKSVKQLHIFAEERKQTSNNPFASHYAMTINTIDFLLSYYYDLYKNQGGFRGTDIFHFIGSYLIADNVELQRPERYRYKHGNKYDDFKVGEKLITDNGNEVALDGFGVVGDDGMPFEANKIYYHEKTNPKNKHYVDFSDLYRTHAFEEIKKSLDDIAKHISKRDIKSISNTTNQQKGSD